MTSLSVLLGSMPLTALAQDATIAGEPSSPHPTIESLSIVWPIEGDDDADGVVTVRYRARGESSYRAGLPLRRVPAGSNEGFSWRNQHAGSLFDLRPGTSYEIELSLDDPDGGSTSASLTAKTCTVNEAAKTTASANASSRMEGNPSV